MNEMYAEWLVKRKSPAYTMLIKIAMGILCVIAFFLSMSPVFGIFGEVEFEYLFVTNSLSIDRIYGRSKRKKAWEGSMEGIQIVAPTGSTEARDHETKNMKLLDFSSHVPGAKTYTLISQSGAETTKIIFEPNDKLLQCMRMTAPRKVVKEV